jgi:signal peptidase I
VVPAIVLAILLRTLVAEPFVVPTGSMLPSLEIGDHVYASKLAYAGDRLPERGEVAVFRPPHSPDERYIKRVVGLPGDTVEIRDDVLLVNDEEIPRRPIGEISYDDRDISTLTWREERGLLFVESLGDAVYTVVHDPARAPASWGPASVPPGHVFMMGDNRDASWDSRHWGPLPADLLLGRALVVWWSSGPAKRPLRLERLGLSL